MSNTFIEILLACAAIVAGGAVGVTCLIGFAFWLGGSRKRTVK
jgi:hypothetical protein